MKVLVTGGNGFIGSHLVDALIENGDDVTSIDRNPLSANTDAITVKGDIMNDELLEKHISKSEVIFHLAASFGHKRSLEKPIDDMIINIKGTLKILELCRKCPMKKVIYASTSAIFGEPKKLPITEKTPFNPLTPYSISKLSGELYVLLYQKLYGIPTTSVRFFNVYGPREYPSPYRGVISRFIYKALSRKPVKIFGDGSDTRDFTFVKDSIQGLMLAYKSPKSVGECFNISGQKEVPIKEVLETLEEMLGEIPKEFVKTRLGEIHKRFNSNKKAEEMLGYKPKYSFKDGLKETSEWFQENWEKIKERRKLINNQI